MIPDGSVDLVVIDPPYNIGKDKRWDKYTDDDYLAFMSDIFKECERVLAPNGSLYWWHNDIVKITKLMNDIDNTTGLIFNSFITWDKGNWRALSWKNPSDKSSLRSWFNTTEYCVAYTRCSAEHEVQFFRDLMNKYKERKDLNFNQIDLQCGWVRKKNPKQGTGLARHFFQGRGSFIFPTKEVFLKLKEVLGIEKTYEDLRVEYEKKKFTHNVDPNHNNVWRFNTENRGKFHPCQKPLSAIERIIAASSNEGDVVLDCFMGSGTTAVAAARLNRHFIGFEREPEYIEIANQRLETEVSAND